MRLLYGRDADALVTRCLAEIRQRTVDYPDLRAFLIVPEQNKVQMERDYLDATEAGGLLMAEVLSFRRLAHRMLDEAGLLPDRRVDAFGRRMLLFRVLKEKGADLHSFSHLADRSGFIAEAESVIGDLKRHCISPEQLAVAAEAGTDKSLSNKCHDLSILLAGYDQTLLDQSLTDSDDDLNRLSDLLASMAGGLRDTDRSLPFPLNRVFPLEKTHVVISGFGHSRDFTPQEYRILDYLDQMCASLTITVQADALPTSDLAAEAGPEAFLIARRTLLHLVSRLKPDKSVLVTPTWTPLQTAIIRALDTAVRTRAADRDQPAFTVDNLSSESLTVIHLPSSSDEIDYVAGEIRRLTQTGAYRYKDIAIALCDPTTAMPPLRSASRRYRLPLFLDDARTLEGTALFRYMLGVMDLALRNWSRDAVMTVLRSGLTTLSPDAVDLLENDLLARGLFRRDRLFAVLRRPVPEQKTETAIDESDQRIRMVVEQVFNPLCQLTDDLRAAPTAADSCRLIRRFFTDQGVTARIRERAEQLRDQGEPDAALLLSSAHTVLGQSLQQLETIAGTLPLTLMQLRDTIRSGLSGASVTLIPSSLDQIMVGDWRRISRQPCRVLFIVGMRSDVLPPAKAPEGILKDLDRQQLSDLLNIRLPSNARDQAYVDTGTLFQLLTRASERLYVGASGGELADAGSQIAEIIPQHREVLTDARMDLFNPRMNALSAAWHRAALLSGSGLPLPLPVAAAWRTLVRRLSQDPVFSVSPSFNVCRMTDTDAVFLEQMSLSLSADACPLPGIVDAAVIRRIYEPLPSMSVSQLEKYAACPFSHLAAYILRLQERAVYAPEAADTGTLLHRFAELALIDLSVRLSAEDVSEENQRAVLRAFAQKIGPAYCDHLMDEAIRLEQLPVLLDPGVRSAIGRKLRRMAGMSLSEIVNQLEAGGFLPRHLEWRFGPEQQAPFGVILPDGQTLRLRGLIDRIDLCVQNGQSLFRIIDYKSGGKTVDPDALYHGLDLQLPAYLAAYSASFPDAVADEAAYFHFDRPIIRSGRTGTDPEVIEKLMHKAFELRTMGMDHTELAMLQRHTLQRMASLSGNLFSGQFQVAPRKLRGGEPACRTCSFAAVCGFDGKDFRYLDPVIRLLAARGERTTRKRQALSRLMALDLGLAEPNPVSSDGEGES